VCNIQACLYDKGDCSGSGSGSGNTDDELSGKMAVAKSVCGWFVGCWLLRVIALKGLAGMSWNDSCMAGMILAWLE
jgi:hypothetical protein